MCHDRRVAVLGERCTTRTSARVIRSSEPRPVRESSTVDVGDCKHADRDQRQLMADPVLGCGRHGPKSSRGTERTLIPIGNHRSPGQKPRKHNEHEQRDQRESDPRLRHHSPSVIDEFATDSDPSRAERASRPSKRRTSASTRSKTRARPNATGTTTRSTTIDCGTNGRPVIHNSIPSHHVAIACTTPP